MTDSFVGWVLADAETTADLGNFLRRAARLDAEAAVRVQAVGTVAAVYVCPLSGGTLPTVLGLRTIALAEPSALDVVVPVSALLDRLARVDNGTRLPVPPAQVSAPWAGLLPPRSGWVAAGTIPVQRLRAAAGDGIAEIAAGAPEGSGSAAVSTLRGAVWSRAVEGGPDSGVPVPAGVGFAAHALGFLPSSAQENAPMHTNARWTRLSTPGGFVLWRQPLLA